MHPVLSYCGCPGTGHVDRTDTGHEDRTDAGQIDPVVRTVLETIMLIILKPVIRTVGLPAMLAGRVLIGVECEPTLYLRRDCVSCLSCYLCIIMYMLPTCLILPLLLVHTSSTVLLYVIAAAVIRKLD